MYVFTQPLPYGHDVTILKRSTAGLNLDISYSETGCPNKAKEISLPNYLPKAGGSTVQCIPFTKTNYFVQDLISRCRVAFFIAITVTLSILTRIAY